MARKFVRYIEAHHGLLSERARDNFFGPLVNDRANTLVKDHWVRLYVPFDHELESISDAIPGSFLSESILM